MHFVCQKADCCGGSRGHQHCLMMLCQFPRIQFSAWARRLRESETQQTVVGRSVGLMQLIRDQEETALIMTLYCVIIAQFVLRELILDKKEQLGRLLKQELTSD